MPSVLKYKFGQFEADVNAGELYRDGARLRLQLQPFQVLVALLERPREVVTREELRVRLWPEDTFVDFDHGLNTAMAKVRDALGDSASRPRYVETIAKRGYRFLADVQVVQEPSPAAAVPSVVESSSPVASNTSTNAQAAPRPQLAPSAERDLPRASRRTSRLLFVLAQIMYLSFYFAALFDWRQLDRASSILSPQAGPVIFAVYLVTALVGVAVRLYLITATAFDYQLLGAKYRILYPGLFLLDMIWALAPCLLADRMGWGLALGACAALIYMPFAQRVLVRMMQRSE